MKRILLIMVIFLPSLCAMAQEENKAQSPHNVTAGADLVSRYIWRGLVFSPAVNAQPWIDYTYKNLSVGGWGSYALGANYFESDLYLSYSMGNLSISVFDYFNEVEPFMDSIDYFNWKAGETYHMIEAVASYTISDDLPLTITASTFIYGADYNYDENKQYYSTYFELSYAFAVKEVAVDAFAGACINEGLYADNAALVNVGVKATKELHFSEKHTIPVSTQFILNPYAKDAFIIFAIHL